MLAWLTRTMQQNGCIASSGLTGGTELKTTVLPFILRGVCLLGVDSVMAPRSLREQAWARLARDLDLQRLESLTSEVPLSGAIEAAQRLMAGQVRGRIVVRIG